MDVLCATRVVLAGTGPGLGKGTSRLAHRHPVRQRRGRSQSEGGAFVSEFAVRCHQPAVRRRFHEPPPLPSCSNACAVCALYLLPRLHCLDWASRAHGAQHHHRAHTSRCDPGPVSLPVTGSHALDRDDDVQRKSGADPVHWLDGRQARTGDCDCKQRKVRLG